jgi:hypothetical protein
MHLYNSLLLLVSGAAWATAAPTSNPESSVVERQSSDISGFDISQPKPAAFWPCMAQKGFNKVAIRGYQQACKIVSNFSNFQSQSVTLMQYTGRNGR